jgi:hypothetical protein
LWGSLIRGRRRGRRRNLRGRRGRRGHRGRRVVLRALWTLGPIIRKHMPLFFGCLSGVSRAFVTLGGGLDALLNLQKSCLLFHLVLDEGQQST